ncbi:hypothetical protein [Verrucomicrobium sp. BvORR034]|uniref:hypothetical protein n=1 Tax=Verrucomicrobium sp. BvORR034 TaxID=1396418 RepID=UPI0006790A63|nr:hypothetical protein [Verrucomicrobium sp. BvORR034]
MAVDAIFNLFEAALWFAISAVFFFRGVFRAGGQSAETRSLRREMFLLAAAFAAFGVSDVIESRTGAWWEPWWLLALKTACVLVFLRAFWRYRAGLRARRKPEEAALTREDVKDESAP